MKEENIIDKKELINLMIKDENNFYLFNLYKTYELARKLTNGDLSKKEILKEKEDKIYTINGKVLSEKQRIILDLKRISNEIKKRQDSIDRSTLIRIYNLIGPILDAVKDRMISEETSYKKEDSSVVKHLGLKDIKMTICTINALLDLPVNFLADGADTFIRESTIARLNTSSLLKDNEIAYKKLENIDIKDKYKDLYNDNINKDYKIYNKIDDFFVKGAK